MGGSMSDELQVPTGDVVNLATDLGDYIIDILAQFQIQFGAREVPAEAMNRMMGVKDEEPFESAVFVRDMPLLQLIQYVLSLALSQNENLLKQCETFVEIVQAKDRALALLTGRTANLDGASSKLFGPSGLPII
jgi:hypothetical protein